jgi:hypothetical protein
MKFPKPYRLPLRPYGWIIVVFAVAIIGVTTAVTRLPEVRSEIAAQLADQKDIQEALGAPLQVSVYYFWTKVAWDSRGKSGRFRCKATGPRGSDYYSVEWRQSKENDTVDIYRITTGPLTIYEKKK